MKKRIADKSISCEKRKDIIAIKRQLSTQQYFGISVMNGSCVFKQFKSNAKTIQTDIDWTIVQNMFNLNDLNKRLTTQTIQILTILTSVMWFLWFKRFKSMMS